MNSEQVRLMYMLYVFSVIVLFPIKIMTHPTTFGKTGATTSDFFKAAAGTVLLGLWVTGFAFSFIIISGRSGSRKMQLLWIGITLVSFAIFSFILFQEISAGVTT